MNKKKNKNKNKINQDRTIDSIIEETRFLAEQEEMAKEAAKISAQPKMEEIFSNKSKEIRLKSQSPLEADPDDIDIEKLASTEEATKVEEPEEVIPQVTLRPTLAENTKISREIIEDAESLNVRSLNIKDMDSIDISLDEDEVSEKEEKAEFASADITKNPPPNTPPAPDELSSFERVFGKPKPVSAVQTVVSRVPVYQHESKVEKIHVRAGKFSAVVENEYKKYLASPNPVISQTYTPEEDPDNPEEDEKVTPKKVANDVMGKVVGFFSSEEDDPQKEFKEKTIQIEDFRSRQDTKSIMLEINANIRKMAVNSIYTGVFAAVSLILSIVTRIMGAGAGYAAALIISIVNLLLLLVSCWINRVTVGNGLSSLKKFKGNSDTGAAVCVVATVMQGIVSLIFPEAFFSGAYHLYATIGILALLLNCLGKLFMVRRVKENFKFVSQKAPTYAGKIYTNEEIARKLMSGTTQDKPIVAYQHETDFMSDFLRLSYSPDPSEDMASKLAPVTLICTLFVGILYGIISRDVAGAFSALAIIACVSVPLCDLLAVNLPLYRLSKETLSKNAMLSGYPAVRQFCDTRAVICEARDLYPIESITLCGVKAFVNSRVEETMVCAAAVLREAKNPMACIFDKVVETKGGRLPKVESVLYEDKLGLIGWVEGERILVGNRSLMEKYAIKVPDLDFENKHKIEDRVVTYLARSGELVAMFVISYASTLRIAELLQQAEANGVSFLVQTTDCNVTGEKIAEDFGIYFRSVKVLPTGLGNVCIEITSQKEDTSRAYLATRGSFFSLLRGISGCIRMRSNISLSVVIQLIGVILGVLVAATLVLCAGVSALKGIEVLVFMLFWVAAALIAPAIQKP